jgi:sigma-B regulation protein RsbU (phosphoserine phosphatase)
LILAQSPVQVATAEDFFLRAIAIARRQQSRAWELRATMSLARLRQRQCRGDDAFAILSDVYGRFQEGFETPDLIEAASLKEDLGDQRMRADVAAGLKFVRDCIPAPVRGPVSVDWRYIPAVTLGGDTLGYHWIDEDHIAFYLIDVTGHGLDSALLAVTVTTVVRSGSLPDTDMRRPDQVLGRLNQAFPAQQYSNKFFTIWYGVFQPSTRVLYWSGGGHPPSIILSPGSSEPLILPSTGPPIGVLPNVEFPIQSCSIVPDGRLLIFSDGAYEILRERRLTWSLAQCIEYLGERSSRGGNLMDDLLSHVRDLHGSQQLDDDFSIIEASFS